MFISGPGGGEAGHEEGAAAEPGEDQGDGDRSVLLTSLLLSLTPPCQQSALLTCLLLSLTPPCQHY